MANSPTADMHGGRSASPAIFLPGDAVILLIGIAASGKTTFAGKHFAPTEVLSSDAFRALIADEPSAQGATDDAFDLLHRLLEMRLRRGRLTVVDATNVEDWARADLIKVAKRHRRPVVAIVLDVPIEVALGRNVNRASPRPPPSALRRQQRWLADSLPALAHEGFDKVHVLGSVDEVDAARVQRAAPAR